MTSSTSHRAPPSRDLVPRLVEHPFRVLVVSLAVSLATGLALPSWAQTVACRAQSTSPAPTVLELYTSEGCSSCPPADRWFSRLKGRADVVPLAFHVTYWDRLGWPDRFASPDFTARQHDAANRAGRAQVYTPQVMAAGRDWPSWGQWNSGQTTAAVPAARLADAGPVPQVRLERVGDLVTAHVAAIATTSTTSATSATSTTSTTTSPTGASKQYSGYFVVVEDNHSSQVKSGENAGENLRHDHVVRMLRPVQAWASTQGTTAQLTVSVGAPQHPRRVVFVVQDAVTRLPLQAVVLAC